MIKIVTIVGARPQFIKVAAVSRAMRQYSNIQEILVHTGQHYDSTMSAIFFDELEIPPPNFNLGIGSMPPAEQISRMLLALEPVLASQKPDYVLVYGDTNSTLAGALAVVKAQLRLAHIEAGLRSFNRKMPEENNRLVTDHLADVLFTPTKQATENLVRENIDSFRVHQVGDVMYDTILFYADKIGEEIHGLKEIGVEPKTYILATIHRAENTDEPNRLQAIWEGLNLVAGHVPVVLPLHPRTRQALNKENFAAKQADNLHLIDPVSYLEMIRLEKHAHLIVTDSGGVQKEAFFHGVPCVTLRDETEWVELVEGGWNHLIPPTNSTAIVNGIKQALDSITTPRKADGDWFGDGTAAKKIVDALIRNA